jgi:hypothetical protein
VIKDSGTQYQIYSIFSFYKTIPDKSSNVQPNEDLSKMSKAELVNKLIELTLPLHPSSGNDELMMSIISPDDSMNPGESRSPERG